MRRFSVITRICLSMIMIVAATVLVSGCSSETSGARDSAARSQELTLGEFPESVPATVEVPPPPMLRTPRTAVYSYLTWISYAYRVLDSAVASQTFSVYEEVRINSYVQLNKQEGRAIDQRLTDFQVRKQQSKGNTATVSARESWSYRYIDMATGAYKGEPHQVSYDSTYTVVKTAGKGWLVDKVAVKAVGAGPQ